MAFVNSCAKRLKDAGNKCALRLEAALNACWLRLLGE